MLNIGHNFFKKRMFFLQISTKCSVTNALYKTIILIFVVTFPSSNNVKKLMCSDTASVWFYLCILCRLPMRQDILQQLLILLKSSIMMSTQVCLQMAWTYSWWLSCYFRVIFMVEWYSFPVHPLLVHTWTRVNLNILVCIYLHLLLNTSWVNAVNFAWITSSL